MDSIERACIVLGDLPLRDGLAAPQPIRRIVANEGESCYQNCDCTFGLICRESVCLADW